MNYEDVRNKNIFYVQNELDMYLMKQESDSRKYRAMVDNYKNCIIILIDIKYVKGNLSGHADFKLTYSCPFDVFKACKDVVAKIFEDLKQSIWFKLGE